MYFAKFLCAVVLLHLEMVTVRGKNRKKGVLRKEISLRHIYGVPQVKWEMGEGKLGKYG
jgi:hypothetical protein